MPELSELTADELEELYWGEELSFNDLAERFGVSVGAVQHWMDKHDIDRRPPGQVATGPDHHNWSSEEVTCDTCGEAFLQPKHRRERSDGTFCSQTCFGKSIGEGKVSCECEYCCGRFKRYASDVTGKTFCDKGCHDAYQRETPHLHGEQHHKWNGGKVEAECEYCGKTFHKHPSKVGRGDRVFCSRKCSGLHKRRNPRENGRDIRRTAAWYDVREQALERDSGRCRVCGFDQDLHVHHRKPISDGGDPLSLDNLLTLCKTCHYSVAHENGLTKATL